MEDSAAKAVRTKRDSSMRVASRLVRDGVAHGFVSAGNTGAVMATAKMVQGVVPGVDRPALATVFPISERNPGRRRRRRRQCRLRAEDAGAVRRHGRHLFAQSSFGTRESAGRPAFHRRRRA